VFAFWIQAEDGHDDLTDSWGYMLDALNIEYWVRGQTYLKRARQDPMPDLPIVMVTSQVAEIPGTISLQDFEHPDKCIYWFGGSNMLNVDEPPNVVAKVFIPAGVHEMHSPQAGAIVAWDRRMRRGQSDNR
jgi:hypothetical protein